MHDRSIFSWRTWSEKALGPGFIDLHVHGYRGFDAQSANPHELLGLSRVLGHEGLMGFLLTYVSAPHASLLRSIRAAQKAFKLQKKSRSARIMGLHLEGPFLNVKRRGSHPSSRLRTPSLREIGDILDAAGSLLKIVTLAPELPGAAAVIRRLIRHGVRVQMGHSCATAPQARAVVRLGVSGVTHLFNAMGSENRKEPGIAEYALGHQTLFTELIGDGIHVSDDLFAFILQKRPLDRLILVSDACAASGFSPGHRARFAGGPVQTAMDGSIRRPDGFLAASGLSLPKVIHRLIQKGLIHRNLAQRLAHTNPLSYLSEKPRVGSKNAGI